MAETLRVILAEPAAMVRSLLRVALTTDGIAVVGETRTAAELRALVASELPDVVITNCALTDGDLEPFLPELESSGAKVIVLVQAASPERLIDLLARGIRGYLLHDTAPDAVVDAVRAVGAGDVALHPVAASLVVEQWRHMREESRPSNDRLELTPRESEILAAMVDGLSNKAIARKLGVAVKTVENHKTRVFDKLGVRTQAHAVAHAISNGLLPRAGTTVGGG